MHREGWIPESTSSETKWPSASSKICWYVFKWHYNDKKLPNIPPLLINNKLELDFKIKRNYFKSFFASKSTPIVNSSAAHNLPQNVLTTRLLSFCLNEEFILNLVMLLTSKKCMETIINQPDDQVMQ